MTTKELNSCIADHPKNQTQIGVDIGFSRSKMTRLTKGANIDESDSKLLKLYFYGEIPFEDDRHDQDLSSILRFTPREWSIISILAMKVGFTPKNWIAEQIRTVISFRSNELDFPPSSNSSPALSAADDLISETAAKLSQEAPETQENGESTPLKEGR